VSERAGLLLRGATAGDIAPLVEFENLVFADEPHRITARQWRELVRRAPGLTVVAESGEPPPAPPFAGVLVLASRGRTLRVLSIGVHPRWRRRGVAGVLLRLAIAAGRSAGMRRVRLEVRVDNRAAITLYERHGFAIVGTLASYYGLGEDGVRMELALGE
jgi:ribosomal protein S18 acetylase RimI-like enzyme